MPSLLIRSCHQSRFRRKSGCTSRMMIKSGISEYFEDHNSEGPINVSQNRLLLRLPFFSYSSMHPFPVFIILALISPTQSSFLQMLLYYALPYNLPSILPHFLSTTSIPPNSYNPVSTFLCISPMAIPQEQSFLTPQFPKKQLSHYLRPHKISSSQTTSHTPYRT